MRNSAANAPEATITGIIVERQMPGGVEVLIGGKTDPTFGKVITFGLGGKLVELLKDVSIRVLPVGEDEIRSMIREIRGYSLIHVRANPKDEDALVQPHRCKARKFVEIPEIREFDLNPVILYERGASVVDARIIVGEATGEEAPHRPGTDLETPSDIFYPGFHSRDRRNKNMGNSG